MSKRDRKSPVQVSNELEEKALTLWRRADEFLEAGRQANLHGEHQKALRYWQSMHIYWFQGDELHRASIEALKKVSREE